MKRGQKNNKISYEPEADVLTVEISHEPIDHAREVGNIVGHFTKDDKPVLFEVLEASRFLRKAEDLLAKGSTTMKRVTVAAH